MELLNVVGSISSVIGLLVALFVANKVMKIEANNTISGSGNTISGRDTNNRNP
jgi:hypothetical protein